jgi:hypothetical protein
MQLLNINNYFGTEVVWGLWINNRYKFMPVLSNSLRKIYTSVGLITAVTEN